MNFQQANLLGWAVVDQFGFTIMSGVDKQTAEAFAAGNPNFKVIYLG